jgi:serine/threonine protein phosphatase PrpC
MLTIAFGVRSHAGLVRELNEDSVLAADHLVAVADGMGGHAAGEVASALAIDSMRKLSEQPDPRPDDVVAAIEQANRDILESAAKRSEQGGMGTTLTGVGIVHVGGSAHWIVFNVGDSRVYRYADGELTQVTVDHSEVEELRAAGRLTDEQAVVYPRRNVVTRSLGSDPGPQPDLWVFPPTMGERFVVCSDGLNLEVTDKEIAAILDEHDDVDEAAEALVERALAGGGRDNVTAIVVGLEDIAAGKDVDGDTAPRPRETQES